MQPPRRADVAWVAAVVAVSTVAFAVTLGRGDGPFSFWAAAAIGALTGLVVALWMKLKNAAGRAARRKGREMRG